MAEKQNNQVTEKIYAFICDYIREVGYSPSLKEIAENCYVSRSRLDIYLGRLEGSGRIRRDPGKARSIYITDGESKSGD